MGCDGGTIPKRNEIVKNKPKDQARDKDADLTAKWQYCSLSGLKLREPIVACQLGRLYNRIAIVEHLLERQASSSSKNAPTSSTDPVSHIRCLKDSKELKLKKRDDSDKAQAASSTTDQFKAPFVCPISGLELSGKYKFYYLFTCGCVFSERALRKVPNEKQCIICYQTYDPDMDLIVLNGDTEETDQLRQRLSSRKTRALAAKKTLKRSRTASTDASSSQSHKKAVKAN